MCVPEGTGHNGRKDLIGLGMKPGPAIGEVLSAALEQVLEEPGKNTKEYLLDFCRKYRRK